MACFGNRTRTGDGPLEPDDLTATRPGVRGEVQRGVEPLVAGSGDESCQSERARWLRKHLDAERLEHLPTPDSLGVAMWIHSHRSASVASS